MADQPHVSIAGGCTCGAVRYRLKTGPMFVHCCHCTWCQRETGSAFAVNALIEASNVELLQGEPVSAMLPSPSGKGQRFFRCPQCGLTLWSNYGGAGPNVHFVRTGTLDDPASFPPDIHIYTSTKRPWVILPEGIAAVPEFYRLSEYWPADGIERFNKARQG
jgi:hypothetical protein